MNHLKGQFLDKRQIKTECALIISKSCPVLRKETLEKAYAFIQPGTDYDSVRLDCLEIACLNKSASIESLIKEAQEIYDAVMA